MKIKTKEATYEEMLTRLDKAADSKPKSIKSPNPLIRKLVYSLSKSELKKANFRYESYDMDKLDDDEPCLILMNHSSFIDLEIAEYVFKDRPFHIICTIDGLVAKEGLMRSVGCIPTRKFLTDPKLVKDMLYVTNKLKNSILMYPEASYSFDGTATPLPKSIGRLIRMLKVPVVMVRTYGAFHRDPLYNGLQIRDVDVTADVKYLISKEDIASKSPDELQVIVENEFKFDYFSWQLEKGIVVNEEFRADYLNRVLYKCPSCLKEGRMKGKGIKLSCSNCGKTYTMLETGRMSADNGVTEFSHIPDWYRWERESVSKEIDEGSYKLDIPVKIGALVDTKSLMMIGEGRLTHSINGFHLSGCDGKLDFSMTPKASYSLYADYYWYEIGDVICIGDNKVLYYCFPIGDSDIVAKTRLATEEIFNKI
ncbi:MAG: 1-acyl-sn-glycerol-3-phosphate acyltransferase [Lachnospiraceae bacterium]|nr:1-acyl-sn-glycerol-3-phosphate acyltransferase [Lachnospiraceae bacterium]